MKSDDIGLETAKKMFAQAISSGDSERVADTSYLLTHVRGGETALLGLPLDDPTIQPKE
jgi:hypothetical protein